MDADVKTESSDKRLSNLVAVTVVILSVFMAVTKIKDDNINQAMQKAKSESVDAWAEYQSARVKLHIDENGLAQLRLLETAGNFDRALAAKQAAEFEADIKEIRRALERDTRQGRSAGEGVRPAQFPRRSVRHVGRICIDQPLRYRRSRRWSTAFGCSTSPGALAPSACFSGLRAFQGSISGPNGWRTFWAPDPPPDRLNLFRGPRDPWLRGQ